MSRVGCMLYESKNSNATKQQSDAALHPGSKKSGKQVHLRELTESAVLVPEVSEQHYEFACAIAFGVLALVYGWMK